MSIFHVKGLRDYLLPPSRVVEEADDEVLEASASLFETGTEMYERVASLIAARRPVLLTGSRGCGKSFCAGRGIEIALKRGLIGGKRFLQGNRELPREYLSEDALIIAADGNPANLPAVVMTHIRGTAVAMPTEYRTWVQAQGHEVQGLPWPAIPDDLVDGVLANAANLQGDDAIDPRLRFWKPGDWWVLFLDEINRFGDGFLDGLLSLTEEGKIVRRGQAYYVPVVVVCTANPPGYDITAKRLSPPLQSRIAASYRIGQPGIETLCDIILADRMKQLRQKLAKQEHTKHLTVTVPADLGKCAAMVLMCLWGNPGLGRDQRGVTKGVAYLRSDTRWQMQQLFQVDHPIFGQRLARAMCDIGELVDYGPDARAICDWFVLSVEKLVGKTVADDGPDLQVPKTIALTSDLLRAECVPVLGKKVRENYNEASDPAKDQRKDALIVEIFSMIFHEVSSLKSSFGYLIHGAADACVTLSKPDSPKRLPELLVNIPIRWRTQLTMALADLLAVVEADEKKRLDSVLTWHAQLVRGGEQSLLSGGCFRRAAHRVWLAQALVYLHRDQKIGAHLARLVMRLPCKPVLAYVKAVVRSAGCDEPDGMAPAFPHQAHAPGWRHLTSAEVEAIAPVLYEAYSEHARGADHNVDRRVGIVVSLLRQLPKPVTEFNNLYYWYVDWYEAELIANSETHDCLTNPLQSPRGSRNRLRREAREILLACWERLNISESDKALMTEWRNLVDRAKTAPQTSIQSKPNAPIPCNFLGL